VYPLTAGKRWRRGGGRNHTREFGPKGITNRLQEFQFIDILFVPSRFLRKIAHFQCSDEGGFVMAEEKIGEVIKFFAKPSVAAVKIMEGQLSVGDTVKYSGHTTDITDTIESIEVDNKKVEKAVAGDFIGIKVSSRVRPGDEVFKVTPE